MSLNYPENTVFYRTPTGLKQHEIEEDKLNKDPEYPSAWFAANQTRPCMDDLGRIVKEGLVKRNLCVENACECIYRSVKEDIVWEMECVEKWESFGHTVAGDKARISPLNIIDWKEVRNGKGGILAVGNLAAGEMIDMSAGIICIYRLLSIQNREGTSNDYVNAVTQKIKLVLSSAPWGNNVVPGGSGSLFKNWLNNSVYKALVAVIDMLLYKHPNHPYAGLRVGALTSRYKD